MSNKPQSFSVSREDLHFKFASNFQEMFLFSSDGSEPALASTVRYELFGYDFQRDCTPRVQVMPPPQSVFEQAGIEKDQLVVNITVTDLTLAQRFLLVTRPLSEIAPGEIISVDLDAIDEAAFLGGFEVRCTLNSAATSPEGSSKHWHKSHSVVTSSWEVKTSASDGLFEVQWQTQAEGLESEFLVYVNWESEEISTAPAKQCFSVVGNKAVKSQFKRLERHRNFGPLPIRLLVYSIVQELAMKSLRFANLSADPVINSLHDQMNVLFKKAGKDFDALAEEVQNSNDTSLVDREVSLVLQRFLGIAPALQNTKFGGNQ